MKQYYLFLLFLFPIYNFAQPGGESAISTINSTIPYQGFDDPMPHLGTGEYKIYYDNVDGVLDKPIFVVDGFDPGDDRDILLIYPLLDYGNGENLGDDVRDQGFDIVVLNFPIYTSTSDGTTIIDGGADFIQRNAFIFVELINTINGMKTGTEENVVVGPSMGGLISRYALRYMEQNSMDHDTRLFISFDTPHLGANVPIGIQYLFNYMVNGDPALTEAEPFVNNLLNSAAAKQMLIDHYLGHLQSGSSYEQDPNQTLPIGAPNFRDTFQSELDAMGFPEDIRNVAISNGSGTGMMTGTPGMELLNHTFDTGQVSGLDTQAIITLHFTPLSNQSIEVTHFIGQVNFWGWQDVYTFSADSEATSFSDGLDSAPGGQFNMYSFDNGSNPLIAEFVANLNTQYFNFIPTLSSLAISDLNWYNTPNLNNTPFDNTYIPSNNEPHVTLTNGNAAFALNEIFNETLTSEDVLQNNLSIRLEKNPVSESLSIISSHQLNDAEISIVDLTGKTVYQQHMDLSFKTQIPLRLTSGIYVLNIKTQQNGIFQSKLIVK
ncbi:T9SS type A sorting domain-containing protein [Mangrovimonas sp. ST2L15]|uniref:T9SS type A sorting domain-containing protein n=1 Tax=Mangrovimonas sp. ST2L15 TaxID=1645916 RepID=UPI0006B583D1|nr:T9SS type A sorting domain-containing protein [Mangrovimonas sp. ST2L15]